jgi:hypothetical protein
MNERMKEISCKDLQNLQNCDFLQTNDKQTFIKTLQVSDFFQTQSGIVLKAIYVFNSPCLYNESLSFS